MILSAIVVGALVAYYFGLRAGYWAAGVTFAICLVALIVPSLATLLYLVLAAGVIVMQQIGSRRQRPADAVLFGRMARRAVGRVVRSLTGRRED